jgi:hypothetical protein
MVNNLSHEAEIDWKKVDDLLIAGCMGTEIAGYFGIHEDTLYNRVVKKYGVAFSAYSHKKKSKGESILRAHQYAKALGITDKGDNTLLIWLGKQRLNQRDNKEEQNQTQKVVFEVNYKNDSNDPVTLSPKNLPDTAPASIK